jgi:hypothetical protein
MIDVRRCHRFALEARDDLGQAAHLRVEHLDREPLVHVRVLALVDRAHSAFADEAHHFVALAEHRPDERARPTGGPMRRPMAAAFAARGAGHWGKRFRTTSKVEAHPDDETQ